MGLVFLISSGRKIVASHIHEAAAKAKVNFPRKTIRRNTDVECFPKCSAKLDPKAIIGFRGLRQIEKPELDSRANPRVFQPLLSDSF